MKKRFLGLFLTLLMLLSLVPVQASAEGEAWMSFYVSPTGNDSAAGSEVAPFKTLARAQEEVRKYNQNMQGNIVVNLLPGRYEFLGEERWEFGVPDSGSNGYDVIYRGTDTNNLPVISGAKEIDSTWTEDENGIWHTTIEGFDFVRELFVDDVPAVRARSNKKVYGDENYKGNSENSEGFYIDKTKMEKYENPEDVELHSAYLWMDALYHVWDIKQDPENRDRWIVLLSPDTWDAHISKGAGTGGVHFDRGFLIENAYELLDEPGEFYYNKKTKVLSYMPREGEDINGAEILCPQIDQLMMISGDNDYKRVHNLRFEHIKFAHATNLVLNQADYTGGQGEFTYQSELHHRMGRATNLVEWADNVDFESCVFYGLTNIALHFRDGVYESDVVGNVFSDLGASGFVAGNLWDSKDTPPASMTGPANVALHAGWSTSSKWHPDSDELFHALNTQRATDSDFSEGRGWYSRDRELTAGTKPWIMFDLEKRYTLETIRFSFPDDATNEMRSNFEVQVSNDRNFNDYKVIKTYTSPVDFTEETAVGDGEKYRYIRLQKTISEPFSLDAIWAMSNDRTPQGQKGAPADCVIANNYFTRVGQTLWSSLPIWIIWTKNFEVLHNEIYEAPYTGISIGWGWDNYATVPTSGDNKINYNRVDGCMRQAADGGPIYIFGKQYGTEIRGNYMSDAYIGSTGLYLDNGCTGVTAIDNIVMDTNMGCTVNSGTRENTVQNLWSGGAQYQLNSKEVNYVDEMRCFTYSNQPEAVTRIIAEAGLEDEWKWIEARVPDVKSVIVTGPDAFEAEEVRKDVGLMNNEKITKYVLESTRYLLKEAEGGYLPWHFDPNALLDVAYWYDAVESDENRAFDNKRHLEDFVNLKEALRAANDTVYHPSWEEMLTMCDEMLAAGTEKKWGGYPADAMAAFKKNYQAIKATNPQTRSDKAVAAGRLEKIYTELYNKGYTADVLSVNVIGAKTEIDSENKKITVKLPSGMNPADVLPEIVTSPGTKVATELSRLRYEKGSVVIPLFQESLRQYAFWTMDIVSAEITAEGSVISADAADWTGGSWNAPPVQVKGALSIFPWFQPTMLAQPMGSTVNFSLWASRADTLNGIGIVFCAQSPDLLYDVKEAKNSYYLAELKGQDLSLYKVVAGVKEKCATVRSIGFEYGAFNNFAVTITPEGDMDRIEIRSGNLLLIDTLITEPIGENGYFGILSQDVDVKVK